MVAHETVQPPQLAILHLASFGKAGGGCCRRYFECLRMQSYVAVDDMRRTPTLAALHCSGICTSQEKKVCDLMEDGLKTKTKGVCS